MISMFLIMISMFVTAKNLICKIVHSLVETWSLVLYLDRGETDKFCHTEKFQRYNFQNINMVLISIILCTLKVFDFVSIKIHETAIFVKMEKLDSRGD